MASSFNVRDTGAYEQLMGRWSKALAPQFIDFAGIAREQKILDVGCGTGNLTFALAQSPTIREIVAIDFSPLLISAAAQRNRDPRITVRQADACALPFTDGAFDAALALLVLHFVPEAHKAIAEMRRVVRKGGVVAAAVWDHLAGLPSMRMMVDTVAALSEGGRALRNRYAFHPMMQPAEMKRAFEEQGPREVTETQLMIRMTYANFEDYWAPVAAGEGPLGKYVGGLDADELARVEAAVRDASEAGRHAVLCERRVDLPRHRAVTLVSVRKARRVHGLG
jgi:ubiquinone/menaquinone biosynthesis C-methylase UbiE